MIAIGFIKDDLAGIVTVDCVADENPAAFGKRESARDFPMLTAKINYPGQGYHALMGWIQLVRSTDNDTRGAEFEMDPARFFEDVPAPFCHWGFNPVLFDAPSRDDRQPLKWLAHSFLARVPRHEGAPRRAVPILGFSWGFDIDDHEQLTIAPISILAADDWNVHLPYLHATYPTWKFATADTLP